MKKTKRTSVRLPKEIFPISYDLLLHPDLLSSTFSGQETIHIKINKETKKITLHSKDLDIETVKISRKQKEVSNKRKIYEEFSNKIVYDIKNETATFHFKNKIPKGKIKLSIVFSGIINENLRGLYKSKYLLDKTEKHLVTTQFEATDARRAFPCFDEPSQKAIFKVSLVVSENETAISNTLPINIKKHTAGYKVIEFSPSPKMSTYLLAFIIGDFEYLEKKTKDGLLIRVFTTRGKIHQAKFALEVATLSVQFFNEYFDIPYPLPTLDLIAIPDFESGAMENWGAITFRETALLVDEEHSSLNNKQWVALVVAHELAHQWFGNLVTMHWWTDLWLNEGFASYIEYLAVNHIFPDWKIWNQFLILDHNVALKLDGLKNSHPIEITVHHPDEINEIFDKISYSKGASIIRMLAFYLGEDVFRDGLRYYLKKHSYKNTETINLWDAFEKISKKPIKKIMKSWTKQMGYPLIEVEQSEKFTFLSQVKYFSSRVSRKNNTIKSSWQIPLSYNNKKILLTKNKERVKEEVKNKINEQENSFIRVKYDEQTLDLIKDKILNNELSVIDRLGIIRDLFALAEGGYIKTSVVLDFALNYKKEKEYIVWAEIAGGLNKIYNLFLDKKFTENYKKYALSLFSPLALSLGIDKNNKDSHSDVLLRGLAISQSVFYGDTKIIKIVKKVWSNRAKDKIDPNIRSVIYNGIALNGSRKEWEIFKKMYKESEIQEEKDRCGRALTLFKEEILIKKTLDFIMSDEIRNQDTPHLLAMVWLNKKGQKLTWNFIKNNWKIIIEKYGEGGHFLSRLLIPLGNHISPKDLMDIKVFFAKNEAPGAKRTLEQSYEKIESNISWIKDDTKDVEKWLNKNY